MTTPTATKFGQLDSTNQRYSGGKLTDDFTIPSKSQWSPFQARTNDPKEKRSLFDYCNKERKKQYRGPSIKDHLTDYTLSGLCQAILLAAETCGVDTFLHAPDASGKVWDMSKHYTCVSFQEVKTYIDHCLGPVPTPVLDASGTEIATSVLARAMIFDEQACEDSSHLWSLIISMVDDTIICGLKERLEEYGNRGPGLLLFFALVDEVTSGSPQAMAAVHAKFLSLKLSNYPGENVRLLVTDVQSTFNLMQSGGFISQTASSTLVNKFLSSSAEEFRSVFYQPSANIDIEEKRLIGAGNTDMIRFQLTSLGVKALCDLALKTYKRLLENDQWPAASSIPKLQSDALPAAFQALASDPIASAAYQAMAAELKLL